MLNGQLRTRDKLLSSCVYQKLCFVLIIIFLIGYTYLALLNWTLFSIHHTDHDDVGLLLSSPHYLKKKEFFLQSSPSVVVVENSTTVYKSQILLPETNNVQIDRKGGGGGGDISTEFFSNNKATNTTNTTITSSSSSSYSHQPQYFMDQLVACLVSPTCKIIYHHVGKTGGTTIEDVFFKMFPPSLGSCCGTELLKNIKKNQVAYCDKSKFVSFQLHGSILPNVLNDICHYNDPTKNTKWDTITILSSYREPISRAISSVHQLCNKNLHRRPKSVIQACKSCQYDIMTETWDEYVVIPTNKHYIDLEYVLTSLKGGYDSSQIKMNTLSIDIADINTVFDLLRERLASHDIHVPDNIMRNKARTDKCKFHDIPSDMREKLIPSLKVYQNLIDGVY